MSIDRKDVRENPRMAGDIVRYHTWPTMQTQTNAAHTWNVMRIYSEIWEPPMSHVWECILWHDVEEIVTGDAPYPVKAENPDLKEILDRIGTDAVLRMRHWDALPVLTGDEMVRVKIADLMDMHEFGLTERVMGNRFADPIIDDTLKAVRLMASLEDEKLISEYIERRVKWMTI